MKVRFISALSVTAALCTLAPAASAVDSNVNQIFGTVSFSNTVLTLPPFVSGTLQASSLAPVGGLRASKDATLSGSALTYKISVNAEDYTHQVWADTYSGSNRWYEFAAVTSAPVANEPAPDTQVNLSECAGLAHVRWLDATTLTPVVVTQPGVTAYYQGGPQASASSSTADHLDFPVRGDGSTVRFDATYSTGSDPYKDLIYITKSVSQVVNCDQDVNVDFLIPSGGSGTSTQKYGEIVGYFNLLGESESAGNTVVVADSGPFGNYRYSLVPGNPAEGPYDLLHLLPSDTMTPLQPYRVYGQTSFTNALGVPEFFRTEGVQATVLAGPATNLGNTFVMNDQQISGGIVVEGLDACQQQFQPKSSNTNMYGTSINGLAYAQAPVTGATFLSTLLPGNHAFAGNHRLAFGTPNNGNAPWADYFNMYFQNPTNPNAATSVQFYNQAVGAIPSGSLPIQQCVGEFRMPLNVNTAGVETTFHAPSAWMTGTFAGKDFATAAANYSVYASASGLPDATQPPVNSTVMPLCLPAGDYIVHPSVLAVSAAGENTTNLAEVGNLKIGCAAIVNTDVVEVHEISCGDTTSIPFGITARDVYSKIGVNQAIAHVTSGNGTKFDVPICGIGATPSCPAGTSIASSFAITAPNISSLASCGNSVVVEVVDAVGNSSLSGVLTFAHDTTPITKCDDITVIHDPATGGQIVDLTHAVDNITTCGHKPTILAPVVTSKFFSLGTVTSQVKFKTECSPTPYTCAFKVNVR